jgi:hypothetical protein
VIEAVVRAGADPGSPATTVEVRHWGGAMARPEPGAGPAGHRSATLSVIADAAAPDLVAALAPHATGGSFLNFLADTTRTPAAFTTANHRRLRAVKRAYDSDEVFRIGHAIAAAPAPSSVEAARLRW